MNSKSIPILDKDKGTLLLPIPLSLLSLGAIHSLALRNGFELKNEFHITLIGFYLGAKIKEAILNKKVSSDFFSRIEKIIEDMDWTFKIIPKFYQVSKSYAYDSGEKEMREAIVQSVETPHLARFYAELQKVSGMSFEIPPPHITLYTKGDNKEKSKMGIGINSEREWQELKPTLLDVKEKNVVFSEIIVPTRPQADTIVAIFLLKKFGEPFFTGISNASLRITPVLSSEDTSEVLEEKGILALDLGHGTFDHHGKVPQVAASELVASYMGLRDNQALSKLIEYARRDDIEGKGTVSSDPLDRAFGLSGLIVVLNKSHSEHPEKVVDFVLPLLDAHYKEEFRRAEELPKEFEDRMKEGKAEIFTIRQRDKNLKVVMIDSPNPSLSGYLRSQMGGRFDVVAQWLPSMHVNVLTRPTKRIDLRSLTALIRKSEAMIANVPVGENMNELSRPGRIESVPQWYFDPATNSLQNGGLVPRDILPTKISKNNLRRLLELGLSEELWHPGR